MKNYIISLTDLKNIPVFYFICLFTVFLLPSYFVVDIVGAHLLYLNIINLIFSISFYVYDFEKTSYKSVFTSLIFKVLSLFVILSFISVLWSENLNESFLKSIYWLTVLVTLFFTSFFLRRICIKSLTYIIISFLFLHISLIAFNYFQIIRQTSYDFSYATFLKGLASNKNIASSTILLSIPFINILWVKAKSIIFKISLFFLSFLSFYFILALSSRSVFIAIISCGIVFIFGYMYLKFYKKNNLSFIFLKNISLSFVLPFLMAFFAFNISSFNNNNVQIASRISSINVNDESTSNRIRYYNHALSQVLETPFFGVGSGNWKFKSVYLDRFDIIGYTVPYHVHNDFLEIFTELGILGFVLYLLLFLVSFLNLFRSFSNSKSFDDLFVNIMLIAVLFSFFIDSNLNFPHARLIQVSFFIIILAYSSIPLSKRNEIF